MKIEKCVVRRDNKGDFCAFLVYGFFAKHIWVIRIPVGLADGDLWYYNQTKPTSMKEAKKICDQLTLENKNLHSKYEDIPLVEYVPCRFLRLNIIWAWITGRLTYKAVK